MTEESNTIEKEKMKEPRVYAYCPICGVNIDIFIGTEEEYHEMKMSRVCQRCGAGISNSETLIRVVEKGVLAPYQITIA